MRKALLPALACALSFAPPLVHAQELPHIAFEKYQLNSITAAGAGTVGGDA